MVKKSNKGLSGMLRNRAKALAAFCLTAGVLAFGARGMAHAADYNIYLQSNPYTWTITAGGVNELHGSSTAAPSRVSADTYFSPTPIQTQFTYSCSTSLQGCWYRGTTMEEINLCGTSGVYGASVYVNAPAGGITGVSIRAYHVGYFNGNSYRFETVASW